MVSDSPESRFSLRELAARLRDTATLQQRATDFVEAGLTRWQAEGRLTSEQLGRLRSQLASRTAKDFLVGLGGHLLIALVGRAGTGLVLSPAWTLGLRRRAYQAYRRNELTRMEYRRLKKLHSFSVALPISLIPWAGPLVYPTTGSRVMPLISHIAVDQMVYKGLGAGAYRRLRLRKAVNAGARAIQAGWRFGRKASARVQRLRPRKK